LLNAIAIPVFRINETPAETFTFHGNEIRTPDRKDLWIRSRIGENATDLWIQTKMGFSFTQSALDPNVQWATHNTHKIDVDPEFLCWSYFTHS
jgi:hypothetical protein